MHFDGSALNGGHLPLSGEDGILRANERLATDDEAQLLMTEMSPELKQLYVVARELRVRCGRLGSIRIDDVDFGDRTVHIQDDVLSVNTRAAKIIGAAVGDRTEGYVFTSPKGGPWSPEKVRKALNRIKKLVDVQSDGKRVLI